MCIKNKQVSKFLYTLAVLVLITALKAQAQNNEPDADYSLSDRARVFTADQDGNDGSGKEAFYFKMGKNARYNEQWWKLPDVMIYKSGFANTKIPIIKIGNSSIPGAQLTFQTEGNQSDITFKKEALPNNANGNSLNFSTTEKMSTTTLGAMKVRMKINSDGGIEIGELPIFKPLAGELAIAKGMFFQNNTGVAAIGFSTNAGATPTQARISVTDANWSGNINFETSEQGSGTGALKLRMRIGGSGGVGIGIPEVNMSPGWLGVREGLNTYSGRDGTDATGSQLVFAHKSYLQPGNTNSYSHRIATRHNSGSGLNNAIDFYTWSPQDAGNVAGTTHGLTINNGQIGVGTLYPANTLQLQTKDQVPACIGFSTNGGATPTQARIKVEDDNWSGDIIFENVDRGKDAALANGLKERMRISCYGGVGVGLPGVNFYEGKFGAKNSIGVFSGKSYNEVGPSKQLQFSYKGKFDSYRHGIDTRHDNRTRANNTFDFFVWQPGDAEIAMGTQHILTASGAGRGSLAIGTLDPLYKFHMVTKVERPSVNGVISMDKNDNYLPFFESVLQVENTNDKTSSAYSGGIGMNYSSTSSSSVPFLNIESDQANVPIVMEVGDKTIMSLYQKSVIIGPEHPLPTNTAVAPYPGLNYTLGVRGLIAATAVVVKDGSKWADYVFDKEYKLKPLEEVAGFISKNKHLPDVPSEKEIQEKGIDVTEMFRIQMQKIEELTLYNIQLQKQVKALEAAIKNK